MGMVLVGMRVPVRGKWNYSDASEISIKDGG
jgi:hypothetical protein